jgi:hypothetical protein
MGNINYTIKMKDIKRLQLEKQRFELNQQLQQNLQEYLKWIEKLKKIDDIIEKTKK